MPAKRNLSATMREKHGYSQEDADDSVRMRDIRREQRELEGGGARAATQRKKLEQEAKAIHARQVDREKKRLPRVRKL